jgi:addiction module HigA family antidote
MDRVNKNSDRISPVTPGELLRDEFLTPMGITKYRIAKEIGVPPQRIGDIVAGKRAVSADTDLRLCRYLGLTPGYWLRVQAQYDLAIEQERIAGAIEKIVPYGGVAAGGK